jgi:16S rRNA (guanine1516-N2)-methyltransferase
MPIEELTIDFSSTALTHRRKFGGGKNQLIAKAIGIRQGITPSIIDATAGLGKDAFVFASLGCKVQMIERSPLIAALLRDGLARALENADISDIAARMSLHEADAIDWLYALPAHNAPDVIYLDPMFPARDKSALVKKEMRIFKELLGTDPDSPSLLAAALKKATYRVIVKRPRKAPAIEGPSPSFTLEGKSGRFDIYALRSMDRMKSCIKETEINLTMENESAAGSPPP